jgi:hypothetical protein
MMFGWFSADAAFAEFLCDLVMTQCLADHREAPPAPPSSTLIDMRLMNWCDYNPL